MPFRTVSCVCILQLLLAILLIPSNECRQSPIFMNQFAVHIPNGDKISADTIAKRHGFNNLGQIGKLPGFYLFDHPHVHRRSTTPNDEHHGKLNEESQVHWVQQQHEKRRKKRDFSDFPAFGDYPAFLGDGPQATHQAQYRAVGAPFPDPLFKEQWYLNGGAKDGFDMNLGPAWARGYTGKGVVVSILDDGIQTNHPDLALNYDRHASTDINDNDDDPMPRDNGDNKHGTRCAGEVAAVAYNDYCGIGVAYNASIGGVRMLDGTVNDAVEAKALGLNPDHIDVYSASWGPEDDGKTVDGPGPLARRAFIYGVTSGRKGRGSIFVWASGNGGRHTDSCNCDGYTNSIFTLSISSATQGGYKPWYLEECSSTLATTYSSGTPGHDKSVATVDMDGKLRPDHICTVEHTGTSASAPLAAGISALALEANPAITWRDMQYLVVLSSRSGPLEKESGWQLNGVKRKVSHKFGYGLMDAGAMVMLAEQWTNVPSQHICKSQEINEERQIDPSFGTTLQVSMDVNGCAGSVNDVRFLEHVQCKISLRFFPRGNLRISLTSPSGTTSVLLSERPRDVVSSNFDDWPFLSVHFWGEKAAGRWTLQIVNAGNRHVNQPGILKKWQLIFYGTATNPIRLRTAENNNDPNGYLGGFANYPNTYTGAGSEPVASVVPLDGGTRVAQQGYSEGEDITIKKVLHGSCDPECDQQGCYGKGPTQCINCKHYRLDNTCVSRCPPRSFSNSGGACWPCHDSCETCVGAGQDSCLTCAPAHLRVTDLAVCLQQCPEGYYENFEEETCVPCEPNCQSCQDRPDHCTSCDHHLVLYKNKCYAACPQATFETEDYGCASCHATCETCNGSSETQCISCKPGRFSLAGSCLTSCPDGRYADKKRRECLECPTGCSTCNGAACTACIIGWIADKHGRCTPEGSRHCDTSEYYENGHCRPCHSTCETCDGATEAACLTCAAPLLLHRGRCTATCSDDTYMERGMCLPCLHTCAKCVSRINCTQCTPGLQLQSGECRASCAQGYYSDRGLCAKCYLSCMTCSGPRRDQCVTCPLGWQLAAGECHPECPEGFFKSSYGCQKCHHYCRTCKGEGPLQCTSCPPRAMLEGGLCMECLGSQFYDPPTQLCKPCEDSCKACSGPGPFSCLSCRFPLHLDRLNNQCVACCTPLDNNTQSCCHCDKQTGECLNSSPAGKRRIAAGQEDQPSSEAPVSTDSFSSLTSIAIATCIAITLLFTLIFLALQFRGSARSKSWGKGTKYEQLATDRTDQADEDLDDTSDTEADDRHTLVTET